MAEIILSDEERKEMSIQFRFGKRISLFHWPIVAIAWFWIVLILFSGISSFACSGVGMKWCDSWTFPHQSGSTVGIYLVSVGFFAAFTLWIIYGLSWLRWNDILHNAWRGKKEFYQLAPLLIVSVLVMCVSYLIIYFPEKELGEMFAFIQSHVL